MTTQEKLIRRKQSLRLQEIAIDKRLSICLSRNANDFKNALHLTLDVFIMDVNWGSITWFSSGFEVTGPCKQRDQNLFPQYDESSHGPKALLRGFIKPRVLDPADQVFTPKFLQIIGSLPSMIIGNGFTQDFFDSSRKVCRCKSSWNHREIDGALHHSPHSRSIDIQSADSGLPHLRGTGPVVQSSPVDVRNVHTSQNLQESFQDTLEQDHDLRKPINPLPTAKLFDVVNDHLDPQDAFAFAIHLDRQLPKMDFEDRQIIDRSLDHDLTSRSGSFLLPTKERTMLGGKDDFDHLEVQRGSRSINDTLKHLIQVASLCEEKAATIFALVGRRNK